MPLRVWRNLREPTGVSLLWAVLAIGCVTVRDGLGGVMLVWAPSGAAVAAFLAMPRARWPVLGAVLLIVQAATVWLMGFPGQSAVAYSIASIVQTGIAAKLAIAALGGRREKPRQFRQVAGLFASAMMGCLAGAIIAIPFRSEQSLAEFAWWFLANVLGIILLAPLLLLFRDWKRKRGRTFDRRLLDPAFHALLATCGLLALAALQVAGTVLMPLLLAAIVMTAVRFGQMASQILILLYVVVASALSVAHHSPMPFLDVQPDVATLVLQGWILTMLGTVLPISAMLLNRQELQDELVARNVQMRSSLALFNLAEDTAGIGRWRLDLVTGAQDWSAKMLEMNGLSRSLAPDPGDIRGKLPDGGEELFRQIALNRTTRETFSFIYRIRPCKQLETVLRMAMRNEFDRFGNRVAVFGVAMDVTEQVRREEALDHARNHAMRLAAEAQKMANTDQLTGLPNRRCTFARLDAMLLMAGDRGWPLSAILFDIDHFKAVNDGFGHAVGDAVLRQVGQIARRLARKGDVVGRIGGEEFAWLLSDTTPACVIQQAEQLRTAVEGAGGAAALPRFTISLGVAHFRPGDSAGSLLARADAALYAAKDAGRNTVQRAA